MEKKCTKCKEVKPLDGFNKHKKQKDGISLICKDCHRQYYYANKKAYLERCKQYYKDNKDAILARNKKYREANRDAILAQQKKYRESNKEYISEAKKKCYHAKKDKYLQMCSHYRKNNREKYNKRFRERYNTDPLFRLTDNIRTLIRLSISNGGYSKKSRTCQILGCSFKEYYQHIESQFTDGMTWERISEIHIDHRLPLSAANTEEELLALNHYSNLQPMWAKDNLAKGDNYCPKELALYFSKHLHNE